MRISSRREIAFLLIILVLSNMALWGIVFRSFANNDALITIAILAYMFGIRHAFDIDHIVAIDNVTRKLIHEGQKPSSVGLYFSLGHSTVVFILTMIVMLFSGRFQREFGGISAVGDYFGTAVSSFFLLIIAGFNFTLLLSAKSDRFGGSGADRLRTVASWISTSSRFISQSWQMYFVGILFGLGFDSATEIALLSISASSAAAGMSIWLIVLFPILFAFGMSLVDTIDSALMSQAYGMALYNDSRKYSYNMFITGFSALAAVIISVSGVIRLMNMDGRQRAYIFASARTVAVHSSFLGIAMTGFLLLVWLGMTIFYKASRKIS